MVTIRTPARRPDERRAEKDGATDHGATGPRATAGTAGGLRISDAATRAGVSARTLRYYEELGLLAPSGYTPGGERRYQEDDLSQLDRILELKEVLGMNLEEIRGFLASEHRLDELRDAYRARTGLTSQSARSQQRTILAEALALNRSLAEQLSIKLARMDAFRDRLASNAQRCEELLADLG